MGRTILDRILFTLGRLDRMQKQVPGKTLEESNPNETEPSRKMKNRLLRAIGLVFFSIGSIGLFVPLLPTTIFWIVAAWLFASSAPELRRKIIEHPHFGTIVHDFTEFGVLSRRGKLWSVAGIFGGLSLSAWITSMSGLWFATISFLLTPLAIFLMTRPEVRP